MVRIANQIGEADRLLPRDGRLVLVSAPGAAGDAQHMCARQHPESLHEGRERGLGETGISLDDLRVADPGVQAGNLHLDAKSVDQRLAEDGCRPTQDASESDDSLFADDLPPEADEDSEHARLGRSEPHRTISGHGEAQGSPQHGRFLQRESGIGCGVGQRNHLTWGAQREVKRENPERPRPRGFGDLLLARPGFGQMAADLRTVGLGVSRWAQEARNSELTATQGRRRGIALWRAHVGVPCTGVRLSSLRGVGSIRA